MHNTTSSELVGCIRNTKLRDKHAFQWDQYLEESYHRNRMSAETFGIAEDGRRPSTWNEPAR
jgi:hypothetical protein